MSDSSTPQDGFCFYPFTQMFLDPRGRAAPCCWNQDYVLGLVQYARLEDLWNGERMKSLRREFLSGKPVSCARQMKEIRCHLFTHRHYPQKVDFKAHQSRKPARLDVRLNGQCNLSCVMCDVWTMPNGTYDGSDFWDKGPTDFFPHLIEMDVLGGEPFVQKDTFRLMDLVTASNPNCSWAFVTNGHYTLNSTILSRLDKVPIRYIQVSVDSTRASTYERIRLKGRFAKMMHSVEEFIRYRDRRAAEGRPFTLNVSMCVQIENADEVSEFLAWARKMNVEPMLQFSYLPRQTTLLVLPPERRREILASWLPLCQEYSITTLHPIVSALANSLHEPDASYSRDVAPQGA